MATAHGLTMADGMANGRQVSVNSHAEGAILFDHMDQVCYTFAHIDAKNMKIPGGRDVTA